MPGLSGIETLNKIKVINSTIPVVMITKSEEENIMETAIGSKIADYLIKPVNPNQILLINQKEPGYQKTDHPRNNICLPVGIPESWRSNKHGLILILTGKRYTENWFTGSLNLNDQMIPACSRFSECRNQKRDWVFAGLSAIITFRGLAKGPCRSPCSLPVFSRRKLFPLAGQKQKVFVILIDNLRLDQWRVLYPIISEYYTLR